MRSGLLGLIIPLLAAGCRDGASPPQRLSALYVLESINGAPLPSTAAHGGGQQYTVLADSLTFDLSGVVTRSFTVRWISSVPPLTDTIYSETHRFSYTIERNRLTIGARIACPPNANCTGWEEGTIDDRTARVTEGIFWSGAPEFVYTRR
jgi:hypothetical protein